MCITSYIHTFIHLFLYTKDILICWFSLYTCITELFADSESRKSVEIYLIYWLQHISATLHFALCCLGCYLIGSSV